MMAPTRGRKLVVDMGRREFTTLLGGAAAAWPLAARAEQPAMPVVGFLGPALDTRQHWLTAFRRGLIAEGFVEGQNVTIEYRSADGAERLPELAADLVRRQVAVIFASGPPAALAAKRATLTIPIVFLSGGDPLQMGLVSRFHRPDGNVTGFYFLATELVGKRLALLHELLPGAKRVAVLVNPSNAATAEPTVRDVAVAGREFSLAIQVFNASTSGEIDAVFAAFSSWRPEALFVGPDPLFNTERAKLVTLAARHTLPASYFQRDHVEANGLMSYGPDYADSYRQAGVYVGRLLRGARPVDLPVQQPTKFELLINLKTAKALGLEVPPTLLARADEVIE
jgi:putative tryptophan/tyrosine transport system substrate-binding protein